MIISGTWTKRKKLKHNQIQISSLFLIGQNNNMLYMKTANNLRITPWDNHSTYL